MTGAPGDVGIGLVGFGYWGPNLLRTLSAAKQVTVRAVCDTDESGLVRAHASAPWLTLTRDYHELLADPAIDAVAIATPLASHFDLAHAALAAGKHVFMEKPFTRTSAEATTLIALAAARGRVLMVDHTYVYSRAVERLRALVTDGELGDVFYYDSVRANLGRFRGDVDVLWDLAVHDVAILDFLFAAMPVEVTATGATFFQPAGPRASELAYLTLRYATGLLAHVHVNWISPVKIRRTMIGASRRMVVYDDLEPSEKLKLYDHGVVHVPTDESGGDESDNVGDIVIGDGVQRRIGYRTGDMWAPRIDVVEPLAMAVAEFVRCISDSAAPRTDGACGQRVVRVLEAGSASLALSGMPVTLDPW